MIETGKEACVMIPSVKPALPFLLILGDELRKARAQQSHGPLPGDGLEQEGATWARPIDSTPPAEPGRAATYVFTPAKQAA
jgi:hypothetical protein